MTFSVLRFFFTVICVGLQCVFVVFPGHTHFLSELLQKAGYCTFKFFEVIFIQLIWLLSGLILLKDL